MNIDKLQAGRELDTLIAEKVMGWRQAELAGVWVDDDEQFRGTVDAMPESRQFRPSTDIAAAWQVVEKINLLSDWNNLWYDKFAKTWQIIFDKRPYDTEVLAQADTAPLAICRASLKVVMDES